MHAYGSSLSEGAAGLRVAKLAIAGVYTSRLWPNRR